MRELWYDTRLIGRRLAHGRTVLIAATLTLALGIGASTAVFAVADPLLIRKLPVPEPDRLVVLASIGSHHTNDRWWPDAVVRVGRMTDVVEGTVGFAGPSLQTVTLGGREDTGYVAKVSGSFFPVLGVQPGLGRLIGPDDEGIGRRVAVLSHQYWSRRWSADARLVGQPIAIAGLVHTVVGVAPEGFQGVTIGAEPDLYAVRDPADNGWVQLLARLSPGVTIEQAQAALQQPFRDAVASSGIPAVEHPQVLARLVVAPGARGVSDLRDRHGRAAWVLMATVALLLLVAAANVSNVVLARVAGRRTELALQRALGASRSRLARQIFTETTILAALGAGIGLPLAIWAARGLVGALGAGAPLMTLEANVDLRVAAFAAGTLALTALISGLVPALLGFRSEPSAALGMRGGFESPGRSRWPGLLVVAQVALSAALVAGAGVMVRSVVNLLRHDVGFEADQVLAVTIADRLPGRQSGEMGRVVTGLMDQLSRMPGIDSVSQGSITPISGLEVGVNLRVDDVPAGITSHTFMTSVSPRYFSTLGIRLLAGRDFGQADVAGGPPVVVVNQRLARALFGFETAVGRLVRYVEGNRPPATVIGVVADSTYLAVREEPRHIVYAPSRLAGTPVRQTTLVLRSRRAGELAGRVERAIRAYDPGVSVVAVQTLGDRIGESIRGERLVVLVLSSFSAAALAITAIGLFGVLSAAVARQRREMAVRIALGAGRRDIRRLVVRPAVGFVAAGLALGFTAAFFGGRILSSLLFGVQPADPLTFLGAALLVGLVATAASAIPVRRALRIDPAALLRE